MIIQLNSKANRIFFRSAFFPSALPVSHVRCQRKLSVARNLQLLFNYLGPAVRISVFPTLLPCRKYILRVQTRLDDEMVNILVARDEKERGNGQRKAARLSETRW